MMKRTDIHRPSVIVPADYEFVGFDYYGPEPIVNIIDQQILRDHMKKTGGDYSAHAHSGSCMVCSASAFHVGVFYHAKTNTYIVLGHECAAKLDIVSGDWSAFKKRTRDSIEAHAGKQKAFATLGEKGLLSAWYMWTADINDVPVDESRMVRDHEGNQRAMVLADVVTVRDIVGKLVKYGSISDKAVDFLKSLLKRIEEHPERMAARIAEKAAAADCPTGRTTVTGTILKIEDREGAFGIVRKMTVKAAAGYIVWSTVPSGVDAQRGAEITFVATLTPSDTDPKFGFAKRPVVK